jgi:hypothetical protein
VCSFVVRYALEQHVFLYVTYVKYGYTRKCRRIFHDEGVPSRQAHNLVNKLRSTGLLIHKKKKHKRLVFTE